MSIFGKKSVNLTNYIKVLTHIQAHPEAYVQERWHHGIKQNFAHHALLIASSPQEFMKSRDHAQALLDLKLEFWQADYLFKSDRTLDQLVAWVGMTPEQQAITAVASDGNLIIYLTEEQRTPEVCVMAVTKNWAVIKHLTEKQRTPEVCLALVTNCGYAIEQLTDSQRTPEVCIAAVTNHLHAILCLTEKQCTAEVFNAAVNKDEYAAYDLIKGLSRGADFKVYRK